MSMYHQNPSVTFSTLDQYILTEQSPAYNFVIAVLEYIQPDHL